MEQINLTTALYILAAICFAIGFVGPAIRVGSQPNGQPVYWQSRLNWMNGGLMFLTLSLIL